MSKESRHAARLARESRRAAGAGRTPGAGSTGPGSLETGTPRTPGPATTPRTSGVGGGRPISGPGARAGRRERARPGPAPTFLERYRNVIVTVAAIAIVAVAVGYVFIGSTAASYTCGSQFAPSPTPPLSPDSSARLGFQEEDMGNQHITVNPVNYLFCPPASGSHFNNPQVTGPIPPRVYKPDDKVGPSNWIHNLEHGGLVVLYRKDSPGATSAGQQAFRSFYDSFPASPICKVPAGVLSPVIARFDDMPHAYAVLVWDRVLYLDTWDAALATKFYMTESERLDANGALVAPPEQQCTLPSPSAAPSGSAAAASASAAPASSAPSASPSAAASPSPSSSPGPS